MTLRAGDLRHQIVIDRPIVGRSPAGGERLEWLPFLRLWAAIEPLRGQERAALDGIDSSTDTRIRTRWTPRLEQVDPKWRARHSVAGRETVFNIESVLDVDRRHEEVQILCSSGVPDA